MRRIAAVLATICLAGAAAGAGGAASEPPDPCLLVTTSEATPVFGAAPLRSRTTGSTTRSCTYSVKHRSMTLQTRALASQSAFLAATKSVKGLVLPIATLTNAYSAQSGRELLLWKDGVEVTISFSGLDPVFATQAALAGDAVRAL